MRYHSVKGKKNAFTLVELLIVIAIIGILSALAIPAMNKARGRAYYGRTQVEFKSMAQALELYYDKYRDYPADVNRDLPPGLGEFLAGNNVEAWPNAPWPNSVYDWDHWDDPDIPGEKIYQISVRFCPVGGPLSACTFPDTKWSQNFGINSAFYYCVKGNCRSHLGEPISYPGYCVNCEVQPSNP